MLDYNHPSAFKHNSVVTHSLENIMQVYTTYTQKNMKYIEPGKLYDARNFSRRYFDILFKPEKGLWQRAKMIRCIHLERIGSWIIRGPRGTVGHTIQSPVVAKSYANRLRAKQEKANNVL